MLVWGTGETTGVFLCRITLGQLAFKISVGMAKEKNKKRVLKFSEGDCLKVGSLDKRSCNTRCIKRINMSES